MHWNSLSDFLAMGGYAGYVWWSFGVTAACMAIEPFLATRRLKDTQKRLARQIKAESRITE